MTRDDPVSNAPSHENPSVDELFAGVRAADIAVVARALTLVESNKRDHQTLAEELLTRLMPHTGEAIRVGITGPPGVGKSTLIETLGLRLTGAGYRVAVLAIDPSSDISGGSILGDKTRMPRLAAEPKAFIRPSPAAGNLGGVARKTRESMLLCEAAGYDVVLIETVGVGQSESLVAHMTDCLLALALPQAGDELQAIKRGLLEVVDLLVVNQCDGQLQTVAEAAATQYRSAFGSLSGRQMPEVFTCSALEDQGVDAVWNAVSERHARMTKDGTLADRREQQDVTWLWATVEGKLRQMIEAHPKIDAIRADVERKVLAREISAESAARMILEACGLR